MHKVTQCQTFWQKSQHNFYLNYVGAETEILEPGQINQNYLTLDSTRVKL